MDLATRYLGFRLRTPLVASSSPLTGSLDGLRRLEDAGIAAVVLPSLFEEQLDDEALRLHHVREAGTGIFAEASDYLPDFVEAGVGPDDLLELVRRAKETLHIPVIASLNGTSPGGWVEHARLLEQAGADALELNIYQVAADPAYDAATLEAREVELVEVVRAGIEIPLAVKLSPFYTAFAHFARRIVAAGAQGLVVFNRFYQPDLDLETLEVVPHLVLSRQEESRLALRWIAILRRRLSASLAATSGVHGPEEVLKLLLAGADVTMMASALLELGVAIVPEIEAALARWLEEREYDSVEQMQGSVSQAAVRDPNAFERAQYRSTLLSWR